MLEYFMKSGKPLPEHLNFVLDTNRFPVAAPGTPPPTTQEQVDHSKMILELVLRGIDPEEISKITGLAKSKVDAIILSEWFDKETRERAKETKGDPETLRGLIRVQAFRGLVKLGRLLDSKNEQIVLSAIKTALEYSVKPARLVDMKKDADSVSLEKLQAERRSLEIELTSLNAKLEKNK